VPSMPEIVSAEKWQEERDGLLTAEKEATALPRRHRRASPSACRWSGSTTPSTCSDTPDGPKRLLDLFAAQQQFDRLPVHGPRAR